MPANHRRKVRRDLLPVLRLAPRLVDALIVAKVTPR